MIISKMHAVLLAVFPLFKFRFDAPLIHIGFIKSLVVASIPGFLVCMWCAAKKHCLAYNLLGISSRVQLLFPTEGAALPSSMLFIGDTAIFGICVALALCTAVRGGSKYRFFNCSFLQWTVSLTVIIIIMNWFQSAQGVGQPALQYVASGVIGFGAVHYSWNGEIKQLMGDVWDWNMYGTKLKKFHGWFLHTAEDGDGGDATALPEDRGDGSSSGSDDHDDDEDSSEGSEDITDYGLCGPHAVQVLAIRANFHIREILARDWRNVHFMYHAHEGEVQKEGMVDLVPIGSYRIIEAYGGFGLVVTSADEEGLCVHRSGWDVTDGEVKEYTQTLYGGPGRKLEITYLVMPDAIETHVEVRLNLKDNCSRSRAVYGSIKASAIDFGGKSVHLFSRERGRSLSVPCGSTCILPLGPYVIALPYRRHFKIHLEMDLRVITTCDSQEEDNNLKFCLEFTRGITRQERQVDGDQVEVNITWYLDKMYF